MLLQYGQRKAVQRVAMGVFQAFVDQSEFAREWNAVTSSEL
jgi:hypothetical protein